MKYNKVVEGLKESNILTFNHEISSIEGLVKLTLGEPDFDTPDHIKEAGKRAIDENKTKYTSSRGIEELRVAAAEYYGEKFGYQYDKDSTLVTVGATEAMAATFKAILNEGDHVIIPTPTFPMYFPEVLTNKGQIDLIDTSDNGFILDGATLERYIEENPDKNFKAIVLIYPNNPTGVTYSRDQLEDLAKVIEKHDMFAVCDEIYAELVYEKKHESIAQFIPNNTIIITGLSKSHAMTGWRIGYIFSDAYTIDQIAKTHEFNVTNTTSISQYAALQAMVHGKKDSDLSKGQFKKRRDYLLEELAKFGFEFANPDGAFYIFAKIPENIDMNSVDFAYDLAKKAKVGTIPGSFFGKGGEGYLRLSYATSMENLEEAVENLKEYFNQ